MKKILFLISSEGKLSSDSNNRFVEYEGKILFNHIERQYSNYLNYKLVANKTEKFSHFTKTSRLLGIEHNFNYKKIDEEIKNGTCKLYADD